MLSDWRLSRERDAHTRCPDMGPRSASRLAGLRRSLRNGQARFERARKVVLPPFSCADSRGALPGLHTRTRTLLVDLGCPMCARRSPYVACLVDTAQAVVCALSSPQASPSLGPDPRCVDSPACTPVCAHFYVRSKSVRLLVLLQTRPSPPGVTGPLVWLDLRMLRWPLAHPAALASQLPPSGTPNSIAHQHGIPAGSGKSVHPPIGCV